MQLGKRQAAAMSLMKEGVQTGQKGVSTFKQTIDHPSLLSVKRPLFQHLPAPACLPDIVSVVAYRDDNWQVIQFIILTAAPTP